MGTVRAVNQVICARKLRSPSDSWESGAGKSMLGRSLMGLIPYPGQVPRGQVFWKGEDLLRKSEKRCGKSGSGKSPWFFRTPSPRLTP